MDAQGSDVRRGLVVSASGAIALSDLVGWIITAGSLCTAIVAVGKLINMAGKPNKEQNERLSKLEERMDKCESKLNSDNTSIEEQQKVNAVMMRSMHALLEHGIDGNNIDEMKACKEEINQRLYKQGGAIR